MVAIGWRKLGDDKEELCGVLDDLLAGVVALKAAVRRGGRVDGFCLGNLDLKAIWCPELQSRSSSGDSEVNPSLETVKRALRRMKDVKKALCTILGSLEETIGLVTDSNALDCRATGLDSLPDELLARILELCHHNFLENIPGVFESEDSTRILASVCKRFRHIVIHLPFLWKHVSVETPVKRLPFHAARASTLCVRLEPDFLRPQALENMLDRILPNRYWEELRLDFYFGERHELFQELSPRIAAPFESLVRFEIANWNDREEMGEETHVARLDSDMRTLASWRFPRLTYLKLEDFLPPIPMDLSNVTALDLFFPPLYNTGSMWSLGSLRDLFQSMPKLTSLTMSLTCLSKSPTADIANATVEQRPPARLTDLDISFIGHPPLQTISRLMDLVDTQSLARLSVSIDQNKERTASWLRETREIRNKFSSGWVKALFSHTGEPSRIRSFPAVEEFSLEVAPSPELLQPKFGAMFKALRNVKDLSLTLPDYLEVDLCAWAQSYGGLRELRSMRLNECTRSVETKYSDFFRKLSNAETISFPKERWEKFERLEVVNSSIKWLEKEPFEEYLGGKLVRRNSN